jgi:hypothetical protein
MLSDMQFGSRWMLPQCCSEKVLTYEYIQIINHTAAFVKNDVIGCYN